MISGNKDIDREILKRVGDKNVLRISCVSRKMREDVCNDEFLLNLLKRYPKVEKLRKAESMKKFFAKVVYYVSRLKHVYDFEYEGGDFEVQYNLLERYCYHKDMLLAKAAEAGEISLVKYARPHVHMIEIVADAFFKAVAINAIDIVKYLLGTAPSNLISAYDNYAIQSACERGYLEMVQLLVEKGANIRAAQDMALRKACGNGHLLVVKYLITNGADIHAREDLALREAAKRNHFELVEFLLQSGADPHAKNDLIFDFITNPSMLNLLEKHIHR